MSPSQRIVDHRPLRRGVALMDGPRPRSLGARGQKVCNFRGVKTRPRPRASSPRSLCPMDSSSSAADSSSSSVARLDGGLEHHAGATNARSSPTHAEVGEGTASSALSTLQEGLGGPSRFSSRNAASTPRRTASCRRRAPAGRAVRRDRLARLVGARFLPAGPWRTPGVCRSPGSGSSVSTASMSD